MHLRLFVNQIRSTNKHAPVNREGTREFDVPLTKQILLAASEASIATMRSYSGG